LIAPHQFIDYGIARIRLTDTDAAGGSFMTHGRRFFVVGLCCATLIGCSAARREAVFGAVQETRIFPGMGPHSRAITTSSPEAQRYFNQGLNWTYAFNHDEAIRSFKRAAKADPDCAMAWWGVAYCEGPNYNDFIMTDQRSAAAWKALKKAKARIDNTSPVERALIEALSQRYAKPWPDDREALDQAYADAMANVWERFPADSDVGILYADSMMVKNPWELYTNDFEPNDDAPIIESVLEQVLQMDADNPGANHLYIHAVEMSKTPERAIPAADRLSDLVPGSGHLRHMPSHIYVLTGHWDRAVVQNEKALVADARYRLLSPRQGLQHMYMTHNAHMLAFAAMMSGREREAMRAARDMWVGLPKEAINNPNLIPFIDPWMCAPYDVQKRFGRWDDMLVEPEPPTHLPITHAIWRAHRAIAYAAKQQFDRARREQERFLAEVDAMPEDLLYYADPAKEVMSVAAHFVAGEIALHQGRYDVAARELEQGAELEDKLIYAEPPQWTQPVRHTLGAVYLAGARYEDAERVYREDLAKWRENGWSLYGLSKALERQGKSEEAADVMHRYNQAWSKADEPTQTSCKCVPHI
jgi:tetratricopeptide (TPR) repeat protein